MSIYHNTCVFGKLLKFRVFCMTIKRSFGKQFVCEPLKNKSLLLISGADSTTFLQGIITNDMDCLHREKCHDAVYAMILNNQGRILHDIILYNQSVSPSLPSYWLECEVEAAPKIMKLLTMYRLRKKVSLELLSSHSIWAVWPSDSTTPTTPVRASDDASCHLIPDPRLPLLGSRMLIPKKLLGSDVVMDCDEATVGSYRQRLYELGVGEGSVDMPEGKSFPLESNGDYLHGVSFTKGCYVGQELTARTHFTGVVRKRLMPIALDSPISPTDLESVEAADVIVKNEVGKNVGKFRGVSGQCGLALIRFQQCLNQKLTLNFNGIIYPASAHMPEWWGHQETAL